MNIVSEYRNPENKPNVVVRWETMATQGSPDDAQTQLLYSLTVQAYKIRILLAAGLFVVPAALAIVAIVILTSLT